MYSDKIFGWFSDGHKETYDMFIKNAKDNQTILEIGCLLGKSSMYLAEKIKNNEKNIKLYCVDLFTIRNDYPSNETLRNKLKSQFGTDLLPQFKNHMKNIGVENIVVPIKMNSHDALDKFEKENIKFDYIFIDGGHNYDIIKPDILKSLKILNENGIIAGDDYITSKDVKKAVDEIFENSVKINNNVWYL